MTPYRLPQEDKFVHRVGGKPTHLITLENSRGMAVALSDFGARIVGLIVPDRDGDPTDVVLGFDSIQRYLAADEIYHGVTVGRFANRIADGRFTIGNETFSIRPNNGPNALHGGEGGFHSRVWDRRVVYRQKADFYYVSSDGEEGFPGRLSVMVKYRLTDNNELVISYRAETDKPTVVNLTNHAFFNLNGEGNGDVLDHVLSIAADRYLPCNEYQIPTGELADVAGTPFDFTAAKPIGRDINHADEQLRIGHGYDHNYIIRPENVAAGASIATVTSPLTGIRMDVHTTEPGVQLYTGNFLTGKDTGKQGKPYGKYGAFCLETQHFPDAPNQPGFPSTLLEPGQVFQSETTYRFSVVK
ncbi:aldose epimerase family protein [Parapedobacter soli]|uniref:aldose epimerase family protein n=1 Tax=Parapedobacter soli TaxID=416955 RepID=UPI0021CAA646|nr:aldose epimerase family protein [Parapedobacter soli]